VIFLKMAYRSRPGSRTGSKNTNMTHGSLFSGIGGFDLAAEWMGWENKFHCEWNEFGQKVLHHYWPNAEQFTDITKTDFTKYANNIDLLTGGFPCQPYSLAGKRKGKEDERHLWPQMCRAIREIRPRWVVGENVFGLINWSGGLVFHEVQTDLETEGYEVWPYVLPACSVNAPHRRDRVWFVAHRNSAGFQAQRAEQQAAGFEQYGKLDAITQNTHENGWGSNIGQEESNIRQFGDIGTGDNEWVRTNDEEIGTTPNSDSNGQHRGNSEHEINTGEGGEHAQRNAIKSDGNGTTPNSDNSGTNINRGFSQFEFRQSDGNGDAADTERQRHKSLNQGGATIIPTPEGSSLYGRGGYSFHEPPNWENFPTQSPVCNGDDGLSTRLDSITFSKWRNESIKAGGNAIVPQIAFMIFKSIQQYEELQSMQH